MNPETKCQWTVLVRAQNRSHRCYNRGVANVEGGRYCRIHAKATVRLFTDPGPQREALIASLPFGRPPFVPDPDGLTRSQRAVLNVLNEAAPVPVATDDICRRAFGREPIWDDRRLVRAHVCGLRARLGFDRIQNIRGFGYQLAAGRERAA